MQMTDTMKPKSRLPITSARDYDNGQVNVYGVRMLLETSGSCQKCYVIFPPYLFLFQYYPQSPSMDHPSHEGHHINAHPQT
jgi:hypothetical protein